MKRHFSIAVLIACLFLAGCEDYIPTPGIGGLTPPKPNKPEPETPVIEPTDPTKTSNVRVKVVCDTEPIVDVVVSDGYIVKKTNDEGVAEFKSKKEHGYVFISVPSGYEVESNGILPQFYYRFKGDETIRDICTFRLKKVDQSRYRMLFLGDMHLANRSTFKDLLQFGNFAEDVNTSIAEAGCPVYALTLGDMAWDYFWTRNNFDLTNYVATMQEGIEPDIPVFHTMGNHDNDCEYIGDFLGESTYKKILGPNYYSFNIGGVHYIVLDDIEYKNTDGKRDYNRNITAAQQDWLIKDLSFVTLDTPIVITMHSPLYYNNGSVSLYNGWNDLIQFLKGYTTTVVTGHTHVVYNVDRLGSSVKVYESNSGAVCGAWWVSWANSGISISTDGSPSGYRIMDVQNSKWTWLYKGTECPESHQFRSYDRNQICLSAENWCPNATESGKKAFEEAAGEYVNASSTNDVLLNIWDWDPSWKIEVTENGSPLSVTQLDDVKDPLYLICYEAYEYEHHYDNSISYPCGVTDHMFRVRAKSATSTLQIRITDRYGRIYTESMSRPKPFTLSTYRQ